MTYVCMTEESLSFFTRKGKLNKKNNKNISNIALSFPTTARSPFLFYRSPSLPFLNIIIFPSLQQVCIRSALCMYVMYVYATAVFHFNHIPFPCDRQYKTKLQFFQMSI